MADSALINAVPRSPFETLLNFRDVGETVNILHGSPILRPGVLFRSAQPSTASDEELAVLTNKYKLKSVLDLRTQSELDVAARARQNAHITADFSSLNSTTSSPSPTGSINVPNTSTYYASLTGRAFQLMLLWRLSWRSMGRLIYNMSTGNRLAGMAIIGSEAMAPRGLLGLATDTLTSSSAEVRSMFTLLADPATYPILVHCTHGKDRTGITIILLLLLCEVDLNIIRADYMATERELEPAMDKRLNELHALALPDEFLGCPPGFVGGVAAWLQEQHGGIEGYLQNIGVNSDTMTRRSNEVVKVVTLQLQLTPLGPEIRGNLSGLIPIRQRQNASTDCGLYRRYFHPLSRVPGPLMAALTDYYVMYYEVVKDGSLVDQLEKLHAIYGPAVRIGPNSVHFSNPDVYDKIYTRGTAFVKDIALYRGFPEETTFGSADPVFAKARRDAISPLFSRRAVSKLEPFVREKVDKMTEKLVQHDERRPVDLFRAFRAVSLEVIFSYCFGEPCNALDASNFDDPLLADLASFARMNMVFKAFPALVPLVQAILTKILKPFGRRVAGRSLLTDKLLAQIDLLLESPALLEDAPHETVYHHLISTDSGEASVETPSRQSLLGEAINLLLAGNHTVAAACAVGCYHILSNKDILHKLVVELKNAIPQPSSLIEFDVVEKLPYLTAVIKESLRLSHGVVSPMLRKVNTDGMVLDGIAVPPGTTVAIGNTFVHLNPDIFPNPHTFDPERWLQGDSAILENYLVPFSKGQRNCVGMNLAWCELYLIFASVFRRVDLELHDSSPEDMKFKAHFVGTFRGNPVRAFTKPMTA
ncbi:cytochrome P450 [Schizophyllum commune H4-8]|uniref:cytochrome P450 n=1 Tax=Schizophyllum commune (strain H4-8 / FGSC 9210) TaxID=578458 RepID=UPI00215F5DD0|nr:cytochrome P450 [Schizophyllum commune H4-8]KAI5893955.1 cytochrome P450 [Schizophyllum commune H4-8]